MTMIAREIDSDDVGIGIADLFDCCHVPSCDPSLIRIIS
jgi:hypothetical protein